MTRTQSLGSAITKRQHQLLTFIADFQEEHGYAPSFSEMAEGCGYASKGTIHRLMTALEERGRIRRLRRRSRSIEIISQSESEMAAAAKTLLARSVLGAGTRKELEDIARGVAT